MSFLEVIYWELQADSELLGLVLFPWALLGEVMWTQHLWVVGWDSVLWPSILVWPRCTTSLLHLHFASRHRRAKEMPLGEVAMKHSRSCHTGWSAICRDTRLWGGEQGCLPLQVGPARLIFNHFWGKAFNYLLGSSFIIIITITIICVSFYYIAHVHIDKWTKGS